MECRYDRPLSDILQAPWAASRTICARPRYAIAGYVLLDHLGGAEPLDLPR